MDNENRVLAYEKATALKDVDLIAVSGGSTKMTVSHVTKTTGYPVPTDADIIQVWD